MIVHEIAFKIKQLNIINIIKLIGYYKLIERKSRRSYNYGKCIALKSHDNKADYDQSLPLKIEAWGDYHIVVMLLKNRALIGIPIWWRFVDLPVSVIMR